MIVMNKGFQITRGGTKPPLLVRRNLLNDYSSP